MISKDLEIIISMAIGEAKQRRHEFFTLEHILYAFLVEQTGRRILYHCGADLQLLKEHLEDFFVRKMRPLPPNVDK